MRDRYWEWAHVCLSVPFSEPLLVSFIMVSKEDIELSLKQSEKKYQLLQNPNPKATSSVWQRFGIVHEAVAVEGSEKKWSPISFAGCYKCK